MTDEKTKTQKPKSPKTKAKKTNDAAQLKDILVKILDEEKAEDILFIDLIGKTSIADGMIIASGRVGRHVAALADKLLETLKELGYGKVKVEGMANADWVLLDAGDIIIHLFKPEVRDFYQIERIWLGESKHLTGAV